MNLELDHIFIAVTANAPEAELLTNFGLTEGTPNQHQGQGTANRRFFFHNAFIELLYLTNAEEAQSELVKPTHLFERLSQHDQSISPFGVCFRPQAHNQRSIPFRS
ncbi:VOC family protein [Thiolinea disciformis]|uniref:VOC family protein n=1 Tax=Thiolinea disciformis TaxID=125614 RepID=UPI000371A242|nr:VOC family protein [Thiolinea disciformis]